MIKYQRKQKKKKKKRKKKRKKNYYIHMYTLKYLNQFACNSHSASFQAKQNELIMD